MITAKEYLEEFCKVFSDVIIFTNPESLNEHIVCFDQKEYKDESEKRFIIHRFLSLAYQYRIDMSKWENIKKAPNFIATDAKKNMKTYFKRIEADEGNFLNDVQKKEYIKRIVELREDALASSFKQPTKDEMKNYIMDVFEQIPRKGKLLIDAV